MVSSLRNRTLARCAGCAVCLPLLVLLGCKPSVRAPRPAPLAEAVCREIAVPAMPAGAQPAARGVQLRAVLLELKDAPACLGAQLFRGPESEAEQAAVIALMQGDPQALVRMRAAATLGGVKGDPRPAFAALYAARDGERDDTVAAAQLASMADLLPSRAALQWDDGPAIPGLIALAQATSASRPVHVQRSRLLAVLGAILDEAAGANQELRTASASDTAGAAATTGDVAASSAIWPAYETAALALLAHTEFAGADDAEWRVALMTALADMFRNGRMDQQARGPLADSLIAWLDYPAEPVQLAALDMSDALIEAAAGSADARKADLFPMLEPAKARALHAALVKAVADASPAVRAHAATVLGTLADTSGLDKEALRPLLKDIDTQVRARAEAALAARPAAPDRQGGASAAK